MTAPNDSLLLDDRQRAMLREMGVQVWQPRVAARAEPPAVPDEEAAPAVRPPAPPAPAAPPRPPVASSEAARAPVRPPPAAAPVAAAPVAATATAVLRGDWQALFAPGQDDPQTPVWLVLVDSGGADPREGDAGRLLDAMLRAAGLHRQARVWAAAVGRPGDGGVPLADGLAQAVRAHRPAMLLTLGRLAAQAALGRAEPLGRLRGQVHAAEGVPLVVSYEPAYLLRAQDDKARAWEDLCRALEAARPAPAGQSVKSAP